MSEYYFVHNAVRSVHTRTARAAAPTHPRLTQRLSGGDLVVRRGRPLKLSFEEMQKHAASLLEGVKLGTLLVKDRNNKVVNVTALLSGSKPGAKHSPDPNFLQDDIRRDPVVHRPALASPNVVHQITPSVHARGELPDLLKPTLEDLAENEQPAEGSEPAAEETAEGGDVSGDSEESEDEGGEDTDESADEPAAEEPAAETSTASAAPKVSRSKKRGRR